MDLLVQLLTQNLTAELNETESTIYSDGANLFRGVLAVGGKLILTNERLIFLPHNFNLGLGGQDEYIELANIQSATKGKNHELS